MEIDMTSMEYENMTAKQMMSSEISTYLTGRYVAFRIHRTAMVLCLDLRAFLF